MNANSSRYQPMPTPSVTRPRESSCRVAACFARWQGLYSGTIVVDGETLYSAVDRKPKRSQRLRRIENARARPDVTVLVDHYEEDWGRLWWIRFRGRARVLDEGDERERALALLREKYAQYREEPPEGPVLAVDITEVREWAG